MISMAQLEGRIDDLDRYTPHFGDDPAIVEAKRVLARSVLGTFKTHFDAPSSRTVAVHFVPGRVEVLGKHTDYAGGHSLLFALDRGFVTISALNGTETFRIVENDPTFGACEFALSPELEPTVGHWSNYPMTTAARVVQNFGRLQGVDMAFDCDLPVCGGMSGSSALMIATFYALARPNGLFEHERFRRNIQRDIDLAMYLACVENGQTFQELVGRQGVGTFGGSEDHTEILNAKAGMLSIFRFCPTLHKADLMVPDDLGAVIAHSGVKAEKTREAMEQYNLVSRRAQLVVACYNRQYGTNYTLMRELIEENRPLEEMIRRVEKAALTYPEPMEGLDLPGRFRQFYEEDQRIIPDVAKAFILPSFEELGALIDRSHRLSNRYLWNIVPEVDFLQQTARALGAVAASGFGAGFGGSVYALVRRGTEEAFMASWRSRYGSKFPARQAGSHFFSTGPSASATALFEV